MRAETSDVHWNTVLGLATMLLVSAAGWAGIALLVGHFLALV